MAASKSTCAKPVPGDAFGVLSAGPLRFAMYVIGAACVAEGAAMGRDLECAGA